MQFKPTRITQGKNWNGRARKIILYCSTARHKYALRVSYIPVRRRPSIRPNNGANADIGPVHVHTTISVSRENIWTFFFFFHRHLSLSVWFFFFVIIFYLFIFFHYYFLVHNNAKLNTASIDQGTVRFCLVAYGCTQTRFLKPGRPSYRMNQESAADKFITVRHHHTPAVGVAGGRGGVVGGTWAFRHRDGNNNVTTTRRRDNDDNLRGGGRIRFRYYYVTRVDGLRTFRDCGEKRLRIAV